MSFSPCSILPPSISTELHGFSSEAQVWCLNLSLHSYRICWSYLILQILYMPTSEVMHDGTGVHALYITDAAIWRGWLWCLLRSSLLFLFKFFSPPPCSCPALFSLRRFLSVHRLSLSVSAAVKGEDEGGRTTTTISGSRNTCPPPEPQALRTCPHGNVIESKVKFSVNVHWERFWEPEWKLWQCCRALLCRHESDGNPLQALHGLLAAVLIVDVDVALWHRPEYGDSNKLTASLITVS